MDNERISSRTLSYVRISDLFRKMLTYDFDRTVGSFAPCLIVSIAVSRCGGRCVIGISMRYVSACLRYSFTCWESGNIYINPIDRLIVFVRFRESALFTGLTFRFGDLINALVAAFHVSITVRISDGMFSALLYANGIERRNIAPRSHLWRWQECTLRLRINHLIFRGTCVRK